MLQECLLSSRVFCWPTIDTTSQCIEYWFYKESSCSVSLQNRLFKSYPMYTYEKYGEGSKRSPWKRFMLSGVVKTFMHTNGEIFPQNYILDKKNIALLVRSLLIFTAARTSLVMGTPSAFYLYLVTCWQREGRLWTGESGKILFKHLAMWYCDILWCVCADVFHSMTIMSGIRSWLELWTPTKHGEFAVLCGLATSTHHPPPTCICKCK